jgi:hypothetical protein
MNVSAFLEQDAVLEVLDINGQVILRPRPQVWFRDPWGRPYHALFANPRPVRLNNRPDGVG